MSTLKFTKMHGLGNDFVVLDATREPIDLTPAQCQHLGDRRFGVGADQILVVGPSPAPGIDFSYRIYNSDGSEVEQCGNGSRCFVRFVAEKGLTDKARIKVQTVTSTIEPELLADGWVRVDMGPPRLSPQDLPVDTAALQAVAGSRHPAWLLPEGAGRPGLPLTMVSMGNPHAVLEIGDLGFSSLDEVPIGQWWPQVETHPAFPRKVNAGFMQVLNRAEIRLRVHERGAGETLACGTGACAAVVAAILQGKLDSEVTVHARGGDLRVRWEGPGQPVWMTGPAVTVFEGEMAWPPAQPA